jgi:phospholipase D1/2
MKRILDVPRNAFVSAEAEQCGLLIDARNYYAALYRALEQAQHSVLISGWQFETGVCMLRGADARHAAHPVKFLELLSALCEERPELTVYVLAWDFSVVYAKDREWGQAEKFAAANPHIHFQWDAHPEVGGSHHQKFAVVDGAVGFIGGIDICDARWDDCDHREENPDRVNVIGDPCKPYHDVQACFTGPIVDSLVDLFIDRWGRASDELLHLARPEQATVARYDLARLTGGSAEHIGARHAALSRTQADSRAETPRIGEVCSLFADAIGAAERLIYAETQYFTSRSVAQMFIERMRDDTRPKLEIVIFLPHGADTPMEKVALEDTQEGVLQAVLDTARETGHEVRLLYPASRNADGSETPTFIHSKILIIDDQLLTVGSPNLTERSVALDTELAITWECASDEDHLGGCIQNIRSTLLAEHSGAPASEFALERGLCAKLDALIAAGNTRLRRREVVEAGPLGPLFAAIFDPGDAQLTREALASSVARLD